MCVQDRIKADARAAAIAKAAKMLTNESDRMKGHRGRMLLSDVTDERKYQVRSRRYTLVELYGSATRATSTVTSVAWNSDCRLCFLTQTILNQFKSK